MMPSTVTSPAENAVIEKAVVSKQVPERHELPNIISFRSPVLWLPLQLNLI